MVGPSGIEPETSALSAQRSNQLSYGPIFVARRSFLLRTLCTKNDNELSHYPNPQLNNRKYMGSFLGFLSLYLSPEPMAP